MSIRLCKKSGAFESVAEFFLGGEVDPPPVVWQRGVGVAGVAWELWETGDLGGEDGQLLRNTLVVPLADLHANRHDFEQRSELDRYGLTWAQLRQAERYKGVIATLLTSEEPERRGSTKPKLLGALVIDYTGDEMGEEGFDCLARVMQQDQEMHRRKTSAKRELDKRLA